MKLTVAYDGTDFHGWQAQAGLRTVQGELVRCLRELTGEDADVQGASRTDRGVHALGQAASVFVESRVPTERFAEALNARLPDDLRVRDAGEVEESFHARHAARGKHYRYAIAAGCEPGVFLARYLEPLAASLDLEAMRAAACALEGEHDFASFRAAGATSVTTTVRTLDAVAVRRDGCVLLLDFWGRSFLYKQVRALVGTLLEVGRGRWKPGDVREILAARDRRRAGPNAAARGLCLVRVFYEESEYLRMLRRSPGFEELLRAGVRAQPVAGAIPDRRPCAVVSRPCDD